MRKDIIFFQLLKKKNTWPTAQEGLQDVENSQKGTGTVTRLVQNCLAPLPAPAGPALLLLFLGSNPETFLLPAVVRSTKWGLAASGHGNWIQRSSPSFTSCPFTAHREEELRGTAQCSFPFLFLCTSSPEQRSLYLLSQLCWYIIAMWQSINCSLYRNKEATQPYITLFNCFLTL